MEKYFNINESGSSIRCKLYHNDIRSVGRVVVCVHGFSGHKDNKAAEKFAEFVLKKYKDIALITFDLPCHGDDVKKKLTLDDCEMYIKIVTEYAKKRFKVQTLYGYATSFGGYLLLKYIAENSSPFCKIALRCPAIDMYDVISRRIADPEEKKALENGKSVLVGFDRTVKINMQFLDELRSADINRLDLKKHKDEIIIMHGTKDEVVPIESARSFAANNQIRFIEIENADHRFKDPKKMDEAIKNIIQFFEF